MKKLGVYVDTANLYLAIKAVFGSRKLDYRKYLQFICDGAKPTRAIAYGVETPNAARKFAYSLANAGFIPKFQTVPSGRVRFDWSAGISADITQDVLSGVVNSIVLGSNSTQFAPILSELKIPVVIFASGISPSLAAQSTSIEIFPRLLEA